MQSKVTSFAMQVAKCTESLGLEPVA